MVEAGLRTQAHKKKGQKQQDKLWHQGQKYTVAGTTVVKGSVQRFGRTALWEAEKARFEAMVCEVPHSTCGTAHCSVGLSVYNLPLLLLAGLGGSILMYGLSISSNDRAAIFL